MATQVIKFGTLDMTEYVEELTEIIDSRVNIQTIMNRHGGLVTDTPVLDGRLIKMNGMIIMDDATDLRDLLADWETSLGTAQKNLYTMFDDRFFGSYKSHFSYRYVLGSAMKAVEFELEFLAPDPFEYKDPDPTDVSLNLTAADTSVGGGRYKKSTVINNLGNAYVFLTTSIAYTSTTVNSIKIRNLSIPLQFTYSGQLTSGESLTVRHGDFSVVHSADGNDIKNFTGSFIYLDPGNNTIEVEGEPALYTIAYKERYY